MANDSFNPQLSAAATSPLETLARQALRRYGDNAAGVVEAEALLMFIELANLVVDDFRMHPYGTSHDHLVEYYRSLQDARAIPDNIIVQGLLFQYALQQADERMQLYSGQYYKTLNSEMLRRKDGVKKYNLIPTDGGSSPDARVSDFNPQTGALISDNES